MRTSKRRSESFFGIHFDFHARKGTHPVGTVQRPDIFSEMLDAVQPDYLQCDAKGHQGLSSYPTKYGYQAPNIQVDNLKMLRELTAARGVALYAHYSGLFDITCAEEHPDWCVVDENGVVSRSVMSVFGPYADEILIPQLKEIALDYKLDGVWVDGDCWCAKADYSVHARRAYAAQYHKELPLPGDADYEQFREFCRQGFRSYIRHYCEEVKAVAPDFQIASNWMYTAQAPEKVDLPLDFISGDYAPQNSYASARFHARCMMNQEIPWDLMAWGQNAIDYSWMTDDRTTKEWGQYCQEASVVLALGGGFEFFNHQYDGGCMVQRWAIPLWRDVAKFCRERQPFCQGAKEIPQIGILFSQKANYETNPSLFGGSSSVGARAAALVDLCADSQLPSTVLMTHHVLEGKLSRYGAILIPDGGALEEDVISALKQYVLEGGSVLLCGPESAKQFGFDMGPTERRLTYVAYDGRMASYLGSRADFEGVDSAEVVGEYHNHNYFESEAFPMALNRRMGSGQIEALCFDLGDMYQRNKSTLIRDFVRSRIEVLFPEQALHVAGSAYADVSLMTKDAKTMVHIINSAGPHSDYNVRAFTEIPPIGPLTVNLRLPQKPGKVTLQPENAELPFQFEDGRLTFTVPKVDIYSIAVIE